MKSSLEIYRKLNDSFVPTIKAEERNIIPSEGDYYNKYIIRYFLKEVTNNKILEVSYKNWESVTKFLYLKVKLKWHISGDKNTVWIGGIMQSPGVLELNDIEIKEADKIMPGIKLKLKDNSQFYK